MMPGTGGTNGLPVGLLDQASGGNLDGVWFTEEHRGHCRYGIRVREILHEGRTDHQTITVLDTEFFGRVLVLDGLVMLTERDEFAYHEMMVHIALCSIPRPRSILIVGGGDSGCLREVLRHRTVEKVVQCELDKGVASVCERFFPWVRDATSDSRAELVFGDGIRYVANLGGPTFDVVIVDSPDPRGAATGLFLRRFYADVARCLLPGGVMIAQTESPHWSPEMVRAIYRELSAAFDLVTAYWGCVPTYPGGAWTWAYASNDRAHDDDFEEARSRRISQATLYYDPAVHAASFQLPRYVRDLVAGLNPFEQSSWSP
jgi:spermidine synthase